MADQVVGIRYGVGSSEQWNPEKLRIDTTHQATYVVWMDSPTARETNVALVPGVPFVGMPSPILGGAVCISRRINEVGPRVWEVEAEFSQQYETEPEETEPWNLAPEWSWSCEQQEEPLLFDAVDQDKSIVNSAGEPLPPISRQIAIPVLTIKRSESSFSGSTILDYVNHVNSSTFWGAPAHTALMADISASQATHEGVKYWEVTYQIKFNLLVTAGWRARLLDHGTYYWSGGSKGVGAKTPFGDDAFQQVLGNLNGSGGQNVSATPAFVTYNRYETANFGSLSLGPW